MRDDMGPLRHPTGCCPMISSYYNGWSMTSCKYSYWTAVSGVMGEGRRYPFLAPLTDETGFVPWVVLSPRRSEWPSMLSVVRGT